MTLAMKLQETMDIGIAKGREEMIANALRNGMTEEEVVKNLCVKKSEVSRICKKIKKQK